MPSNISKFKIKFINWYPPYIGAGIKVYEISKNYDTIKVKMPLRWYNKNVFNTHFGGSLYAMCDPFFVTIAMTQLGSDYIVWDKAASIKFLKPGRSTVFASFHIPSEDIKNIIKHCDEHKKGDFVYETEVLDDKGNIIAKVEKTIYVRKKDK